MHSNLWSWSGFSRTARLLLPLLLLAGCAVDQPKTATSQPVANPPVENRPADSKTTTVVAEGTGGFTIKEISGVPSEVRADFERAMGYLSEGNNEKGIEMLKTVVQRVPNNTAPYINLAIAYQKTSNLALAEENIKQALAINPDHPLANNEYGMLQRKNGRFQEARATYEKTLKQYPAFLPARKNLAILCDLYMRDMECALKNYQIYSEAVPNDKSVRIWIADLEKRIAR